MAVGVVFPAAITIQTDLQGVIRNDGVSFTSVGSPSTWEDSSV
jgi:hypothetical protein